MRLGQQPTIRFVARRRGDSDGGSRHRRRQHQRVAGVVAVTDVGERQAINRAMLGKSLHVGDRLARMLAIREEIDNRHRDRIGDLLEIGMVEDPHARGRATAEDPPDILGGSIVPSPTCSLRRRPYESPTPSQHITGNPRRTDGFMKKRPIDRPASAPAT